MSDKALTDAYLTGERERLEKWLLEEPAKTASPSKAKPAEQPVSQKDSRNVLQQAADAIYPRTPPASGVPSTGEALVEAGAGVASAVGERFSEGVSQLKTGFTGASEPALGSTALGVARDVAGGAVNTVFPEFAAVGHIYGELVDYENRVTGALTDDVLKARLSQARLNRPDVVPELERLLSLPYEQRLQESRGLAATAGEVQASFIPGYTGVIGAAGKVFGAARGAVHGAETAGRAAAREAVGASAEATARRPMLALPPGRIEVPASSVETASRADILTRGKAALQSPEVQDYLKTIEDRVVKALESEPQAATEFRTALGNESGKVTPEVMLAVARAVVGGLAGGLAGGDLESVAAGAAVGAGLSPRLVKAARAALKLPEVRKVVEDAAHEVGIAVHPEDVVRTIEEAGGKYRGKTELPGGGALHYFDSPQTGSTLAHLSEGLTRESVAAKIAESNRTFAAADIVKATEQNGGASFNLGRHRFYDGTSGYAVSVAPERGVIVPAGQLAPDAVKKFAADNADLLSDPRAHLGTWKDDAGATHLDVSIIIPDRAEALALGRKYGQQAIYDFANKNEIPVAKPGIPVYHGSPEAFDKVEPGRGLAGGFWVAENPKTAGIYATDPEAAAANVRPYFLDPSAKLASRVEWDQVAKEVGATSGRSTGPDQAKEMGRILQERGYAGVEFSGTSGEDRRYLIFDPKALTEKFTGETASAAPSASQAALEKIRANEPLRADLQALAGQTVGQESPTVLENITHALRDETGAIAAKLPETQRAAKLAEKGRAGSNWYAGVPEELQQNFGQDWELVANLIAVTSPRTRVESNVEMALDAYTKWKRGMSPAEIGAAVPTTSAFAKRATQGLLEGKSLDEVLKNKLKVYNFAKALQGDRSAVVIDRWLWGVFYPEEAARSAEITGVASAYSGTPARYALIESWIKRQAAKMGIQPADLQATLWVGAKAAAGDVGGVRPLREYIQATIASAKTEQEAFDFFENLPKVAGMDEAGKANLATIMLLARAGIGAVVGGLTGDDPETAARNALIGAGLGSILSARGARAVVESLSSPAMRESLDNLTGVLKSEEGAFTPGRFTGWAKPESSPNVSRMNVSEPAKQVILGINEKLLRARKLARSYTVSHDETIAAALTSKFRNVEEVLKLDTAAIRPEELAATRTAVRGVRDFVLEDMMQTVAQAKLTGDAGLAKEARQKYAFAGKVSQRVTDLETQIARAQEAGKIQSEVSVGSKFDMNKLSHDLQEIEAHLAGTLTDSQLVEMISRQADRAAAARIAEVGSKYPQALWNIYYGLNLLSSPVTHAKNIIGNMTGLGLAIADRAAGELIAVPFHAVGKGGGHVAFGETYELARGAWEMIADSFNGSKRGAWQMAGDTYRTGESAFGDVTKAGERLKMLAAKPIDPRLEGNGFAKVVDTMSTLAQKNLRFMDGTDEYFKVLSFQGEARALARRQAAAEGFTGKDLARRIEQYIDNPTTEMLQQAHAFAHENTFTKAFDPAEGGWRRLWGLGVGAEKLTKNPLMRIAVAPFFRTPTRLAEYSMVHTPGLNLLAVQFASDLAEGGAKADLAFAKLATGSAIGGLGFWYAAHGYITGDWPKDPALKERYESTGWRPYSLYNPFNGKYYSYSGIEPVSTMLAGAANFAQMAPHLTDHQISTVASAMAIAYGKGVANNPYLQGITDIANVIEGMSRNESVDAMETWVARRLAALVPGAAVGRTVARSMDDVVREMKTVPNAPPELRELHTVINTFKAEVPGWSSTRPAKRNMITGEPIPTETGWLGLIAPYQVSTNKNDKVLNEIVALGGAGLPKEVPRVLGGNMPRSSVVVMETNPKEGVVLTDDERTELTKILTTTKDLEDNTLHQALGALMESDEYKDATDGVDGGKSLLVKQTFRRFFRQAQMEFLEKHPEVATVIERRQLERGLGRLPSSMEDLKDPMREVLDSVQAGR